VLGLAAVGILAIAFFVAFPDLTASSCIPLLLHSIGEETIPIPAHCRQTADVPPDRMTGYLEQNRRGLIHKAWITCEDASRTAGLNFVNGRDSDPRWFPSDVPRTYQFRRTILIFPYANPVPQDLPFWLKWP
jgi:hypothetical protein